MPGTPPPQDWIETALKITGHFEDSSDPMGGVSGDFDGMGISLGVLQWNIGSGSLQPLVKNIGQAAVVAAMPMFGSELWSACNSTIAQGLAIVRRWQNGSALRPPVKLELKAFCHSAPFTRQQIQGAEKVSMRALDSAVNWLEQQESEEEPDKWLFCWFFDLITQNGGLKDVSFADVRTFINASGAERADDAVCDWLAARTPRDAGFRDSHRNAELWRDKVPSKRLVLLVTSFLRAQKSRPQFRGDVLNRKGAIALGEGFVHQERHKLKDLLSG